MQGDDGDSRRLVMDLSAVGIPTTDRTFALQVEGDSMSGAGIKGGDILVLERREPRLGELVAILLNRDVTVKRYVESKEGTPVLCGWCSTDADSIALGGVEIQGVAVGLIRKL